MTEGDESVRVFGPDGWDQKGLEDLQRDTEKAETTQQADVDHHSGGDEYYLPPYPPDQLLTLLEKSETHAACVRAKAQGVAGYGFDLVPVESVETDDDPPGRDTLESFWRGGTFLLGPEKIPATASDVQETIWEDYESVGWGAGELLVNPNTGDPTGMAHLPAHTIRQRKDAPGYVQVKNGVIKRYFGQAGDRYGEDQTFVDAETGKSGSSIGDVDTVANELLVINNYSALAPHYGTPDIIPAIETVAGNVAAREYNLNFFENDGVPRFAVIVEGGELSERAWNQLEEKLKKLKLNENSHRGILIEATQAIEGMETGTDVNIRLEPLTVGTQEDASFVEYRQENEHEILKVHEVPKVVANRTEGVNYANAREQRQEFAQSTVKPRQRKFASRLHQVIHVQAFDIPEWTIEFDLHGGQNRERESQVAKNRIEASKGAITVNEAREELGYDPLTDANGEPLPQGRMLLSSLQSSGSSGSGGEPPTPDEDEEQARSDERARTMGFSVTDRHE